MASTLLRGHKFDVSVSAFGALLGGGILITNHLGTEFPTFSPYDLGASALPDVVAVLIILLSLTLFVQAWRSPAQPAAARGPGETQDEAAEPGAGSGELRRLVLLALLFAAYVGALWAIGFIVSTIALLLIFYRALGATNWLKNIVIAVVFTGAVYYVFRYVFSVPIPARLFEMLVR